MPYSTNLRIGDVEVAWATRYVNGWDLYVKGKGLVERHLSRKDAEDRLADLGVRAREIRLRSQPRS